MQAKKGDPSQFASYWEMDEQDVDEATEEQIQSMPPDLSDNINIIIHHL